MQVAACVTAIPTRRLYLSEALGSVATQTRPPDEICVSVDYQRRGAAENRNHAISMASAEFVAFLDDDDYWLPFHLDHLLAKQEETGADVVFPWMEGHDPLGHFGKDWDNAAPYLFPICYLARRELVIDAGGFVAQFPSGQCMGEDWDLVLKFCELGAKIAPLHEKTWFYRAHGGNTSGISHRW